MLESRYKDQSHLTNASVLRTKDNLLVRVTRAKLSSGRLGARTGTGFSCSPPPLEARGDVDTAAA